MRFAYAREEEGGQEQAGGGGIGLGGRRNIMCVFRICALCAIYELTFLNEVNSQQRGRQRERERESGEERKRCRRQGKSLQMLADICRKA